MGSQKESHKKDLTERIIIIDVSQKPDSKFPAASDTDALRNYIITKRNDEKNYWKNPRYMNITFP